MQDILIQVQGSLISTKVNNKVTRGFLSIDLFCHLMPCRSFIAFLYIFILQ